MSSQDRKLKLPSTVERYLAALSKLFAQEGKRQLQQIIVNAKIRVHESWNYDNWNGGTYGHALFLTIPESLFLKVVNQKDEIQKEICDGVDRLHHVPNESIDAVFLEMEVRDEDDWRQSSGLLLKGKRDVTADAARRIWGDKGYRVFLSHKTEVKSNTAHLKEHLQTFGISCFVAHTDIHPTEEWQDEIECALGSMDAFVALLTEKFHESDWTDQEVGYALASGVPIVAVRLGRDPYGFIGKFQALSCSWEEAPKQIAKLLLKRGRLLGAFLKAVEQCDGFNRGNELAELLPSLDELTDAETDALAVAYNTNSQLRGSFGFNGAKRGSYGNGLLFHLNRLAKNKYRLSSTGMIDKVK